MQWVEAAPLPEECRRCIAVDCYNCDHAGKRWSLTREQELYLKRKGILKTIERLEKQLNAINGELKQLQGESSE